MQYSIYIYTVYTVSYLLCFIRALSKLYLLLNGAKANVSGDAPRGSSPWKMASVACQFCRHTVESSSAMAQVP